MKNNEILISTVRRLLDQSARNLDESLVRQLARTRHRVLDHASLSPQFDHYSGTALRLRAAALRHDWRFWLAVAALVIGGITAHSYWQQSLDDHTDIDIAILTDELPIDVYVD